MFAVATSIALFTALGELALVAILRLGLHRQMHLGPHVVWMTPVALLVVFSLPTLMLVAGSRLWRRLARPCVFVGALVFLMMLNLILVERHFSIWALLILSLGIAVQAGRLAESHRPGFRHMLHVAAPHLIGLVLAATLIVEGGLALRERHEEAGLPQTPAGAPNVLFIILDTVRARELGLYGYDRATTPNLDRLAGRGVVFDLAIAPATWTVPSHASMFTGHWPHELSHWWSSPDHRPPAETIAQFMTGNGYRTAGFIGNWYHIGRDSGFGAGFGHYDDLGRSLAQIARGSAMIRWLSQRRGVRHVIGLYETLGRRHAPDVSRSFLHWIERDSDRPWFAFINYFDAHSPYLPPAPFDSRFGDAAADREPIVIEELNRRVEPTPEIARAERDAYDGALAWLDDQIGRLFKELDERDALDNTFVIIGSDHGEELGEHGRWGHAYSLYAEIVHVPLFVFGPGVPAGVHVEAPASLRNIPATIADLAGLEGKPFPGVSLARLWRAPDSRQAPDDPAFTEFGRYRSLYDGQYHYLVGVSNDLEHLFDHRADPLDEHDLVGLPGIEAVLAAFRKRVDAIAPPVDRKADVGTPPSGN